MGDNFDSNGGEQNSAKGDHAIGKQVNNHGPMISTTGNQAPAVNAQGNVTITYGVPFEKYEQVRDECERLKVEYGTKDAAFVSFFKILEQESIPCAEWGAKLPEIAFRHKELLLRFEAVTSDDPQVQALKEQAKQAIDNGEYDRADALLNQAKERDRAAVSKMKANLAEQQAALEKRQLSEVESCVDQAGLQRLQYRYEKSAQYWQEAAAALPEGYEWERAEYIGAAGYDLYCIAYYAEANGNGRSILVRQDMTFIVLPTMQRLCHS
jgi:tetratricopeptide (TPR) repeat protein